MVVLVMLLLLVAPSDFWEPVVPVVVTLDPEDPIAAITRLHAQRADLIAAIIPACCFSTLVRRD